MRRTYTTVLIAMALTERPDDEHYGYDLMKTTGIPSGVLYPILQRMQEHGWVESGWELPLTTGRPRRIYRLTDKGQSEIDNWERRAAPPTETVGETGP